MTKKFKKLIQKNNVQKEVYCGEVNANINKSYQYGEEHAIIRKTLAEVINILKTQNIDSTIFQEFLEYNEYVENLKKAIKQDLEI